MYDAQSLIPRTPDSPNKINANYDDDDFIDGYNIDLGDEDDDLLIMTKQKKGSGGKTFGSPGKGNKSKGAKSKAI